MDALFDGLSHLGRGALPAALLAAVAWGALSIVLSPCSLAGMPLLMAALAGGGERGPSRALLTSGAYALGLLVSVACLGVVASWAGRLEGPWTRWTGGIVLLGAGLVLLDVIPVRLATGRAPGRLRGPAGALALGLIYGVALAPCSAAFLAPVLAAAAEAAPGRPWAGAAMVAAFGLGYGGAVVAVGSSFERAERLLGWAQQARRGTVVRRALGALVVAAGLAAIYSA